MKVCKFGGTSLATAFCFKQVKRIVQADAQRCIVVVSAPGKTSRYDKMTDCLLRCRGLTGAALHEELGAIARRWYELAAALGLEEACDSFWKEGLNLLGETDALAALGEYVASRLCALYLGWPWVDAATVMRFDDKGNWLPQESLQRCRQHLADSAHAVIGGFYGADSLGHIHTLPRGGGDVTGAAVAIGVGAGLYENWTDTQGCYSSDPHCNPRAVPMPLLTYEQMLRLCDKGACVLHPDCVRLCAQYDMPIEVGSTFVPDGRKTRIMRDTSKGQTEKNG